jgi:hypothetical protein
MFAMTRTTFRRTFDGLLAASLAMVGCGQRVPLCDDECEEGTSEGTEVTSSSSSSSSSPSSSSTMTGTPPGTSTNGGTSDAPDPSSTSSTVDSTSVDPSGQSSTGDIGPSVTPGDPAPCLTGGNLLILDGDPGKYVHPGSSVLDDAQWSFIPMGNPVDDLYIDITTDGGMGEWWTVWFATDDIPAPLAVGQYEGAMRTPFEEPGRPGLSIYGNGAGCNTLSGWFEIHELELEANAVSRITATWEQHCEEGPLALRGCIHWEQ